MFGRCKKMIETLYSYNYSQAFSKVLILFDLILIEKQKKKKDKNTIYSYGVLWIILLHTLSDSNFLSKSVILIHKCTVKTQYLRKKFGNFLFKKTMNDVFLEFQWREGNTNLYIWSTVQLKNGKRRGSLLEND